MKVLRVRNVHEALPEAIREILSDPDTVLSKSRYGDVLVSPEPVSTVYEKPCERVLFWSQRDANPFFHFMECLWMMAGLQCVGWLSQFNSKIGQFSDDGERFHGAYGWRWRHHWGFDQLELIADRLREDPTDRRQVLTMWDPWMDLMNQDTKDLPCNDLIFFSRHRDGSLDMTVCCRSNDIIWGCYGANAVHFSFLQEVMAARIGCPVGRYTQISNNWHGYSATTYPLADLRYYAREPQNNERYYNPYESGEVTCFPVVEGDLQTWHKDLTMFIDEGENAIGYQTRFFRRVALPLLLAWQAFKEKPAPARFGAAMEQLSRCEATDWHRACEEWIERREERWQRKSKESVV